VPERAAPPNLLEIARGAAVVSRTGEAILTSSAVRAIDGDPHTMWVCPPGDPLQTLVYSLPARARVEQLGLRTSGKEEYRASSIRLDLSLDGQNFATAATVTPKVSDEPQFFRISPAEASFVRVSVLGARGTYVQIGSLYAVGKLLDPVKPGELGGCFSLNGSPASFTQKGSSVDGFIGGDDGSTLEGGSDGRFYRFAWVRGPQYGLAAMSVTPDGKHASAVVWHEEALQITQFLANDVLGDRVPCGTPAPHPISVFRSYLERFRYFPLYGLRFNDSGRLLEDDSAATLLRVTEFLIANPNLPVRFAAHELLQSTPELNRRIAQARIDSLRTALQKNGVNLARVTFAALGAEQPHREASIDLTRAMYSSVDLELKP
jgi:F5/8 type C domain